jgi:hypothetical protein
MLGVRFLDVDFMRINFACGLPTVRSFLEQSTAPAVSLAPNQLGRHSAWPISPTAMPKTICSATPAALVR